MTYSADKDLNASTVMSDVEADLRGCIAARKMFQNKQFRSFNRSISMFELSYE